MRGSVHDLARDGPERPRREIRQEDDPLREFRVILHFCDGVVLKLAPEWPMDSNEPLYSMANLEEAEGQLFGYGIPSIMEDSQDALNASWRMALDNGSLSVGPQALIAMDEIEPADGNWAFSPRKIWRRIKAAVPHAPQSIQFFDVPNNMEEIAMLIELATKFIDMETGIPQPQAGEEAHSTPTVGGMAILQSSANIIFRRIVKNLDDGIIAPTMRRMYDWNMQFSKKPEIKGDMQVDARGTSVLLVKEVQAQNLMLVVSQLMANPNIAPMIKAFPAVEKLFQAMMIKPSDVMITEDEYKKHQQDLAEPAAAEAAAGDTGRSADRAREDRGRILEAVRRDAAAHRAAPRENGDDRTRRQGRNQHGRAQAMLEGKKMDIAHKERSLVAEAAIDRQNADDARAHGEEPGGSGGDFNAGVKEKRAA
jgi:hypothetical protein